ncbi:transcription factor bHLH71 [Beta vulgaris subsp. vulgaris]|uniref:transcription factor bHLH71 n=1 Tax=Beta vulgaris subsp. vulgaris TaxID=3555 RepID=UPI0020367FFA|nr:transcription factor bHLH71 [Beta vulgaris subsp. vulgaris]
MALEAIPNYNDIFNFMVYETLNSSQYGCNLGFMEDVPVHEKPQNLGGMSSLGSMGQCSTRGIQNRRVDLGVQGRKKRRRRPKVCKNKEEAETQRMTHITVERNRRKQMNEHLAVLRSLMPESYAQRGDQASIVGGAIEFVKELEHLVHSFEVQKLNFLKQSATMNSEPGGIPTTRENNSMLTPFAEFFSDSEHTFSQVGKKYTLMSKASIADIEVTLIETHANLRILSKKNPRQISKLVSGFQTLRLTILHLNVTTLDPLVLYSINVKVEEGCQFTSVDSIAEAVHHMLRIIIERDDVPFLLTY